MRTVFEVEDAFEPRFSSNEPIFLKDGLIICGHDNGKLDINVIEGETFRLLKNLNADEDDLSTFVVSPVNEFVYVASKSNNIKQIDLNTGYVTKTWRSCHQKPVYRMALNATSTRLATGAADGTLRFWHIGPSEGASKAGRSHDGIVTLVKFHNTKPLVFSASMGDHFLSVSSPEDGSTIAKLEHQTNVSDVTFIDETIATCARDKVIIIWALGNFERLRIVPCFEMLDSLIFLPDGALANHLSESGCASPENPLLLAGGEFGRLSVWEAKSGRCVLRIQGPADRCLVSTDGTSTEQADSYGLHSIVRLNCVHYGENDSIVALVRQSNHVEFYDAFKMKLKKEFLGDIGQVQTICVTGTDGQLLVIADASSNLKLFFQPPHSKEGQHRGWACRLIPGGHKEMITDVSSSPNGKWLLSGSKDHSICVWRVEGQSITLSEKLTDAMSGPISSICFSLSTLRFVSATPEDAVLKVWTMTIKKEATRTVESATARGAHEACINAVAMSTNDRMLASASRDKTVKIWSMREGDTLTCMGVLRGHRRGVWNVRFSPEECIAVTASGDNDVRLWNLKDFSCMHTLEGHSGPVYHAEFFANGKMVISCDQNGVVRVWDVAQGRAIMTEKESETAHTVNRTESQVPLTLDAHDGRALCLTVTANQTGFYTGGEDSRLRYFKDCSKESDQRRADEREEMLANSQRLSNMLQEKRFTDALLLTLQLDQPRKALEVIEQILSSDLPNQLPSLVKCFKDGGEEVCVQRLMSYAANWNSRARTSLIAQQVFAAVFSTWSAEEISKWPNSLKLIESISAYTKRHYSRIGKLSEQMCILDYYAHLVNEFNAAEGLQPMEM